MRFPHLANTFKAVAKHGRKGFYEGRIAEAIVELIQVRSVVRSLEFWQHWTDSRAHCFPSNLV